MAARIDDLDLPNNAGWTTLFALKGQAGEPYSLVGKRLFMGVKNAAGEGIQLSTDAGTLQIIGDGAAGEFKLAAPLIQVQVLPAGPYDFNTVAVPDDDIPEEVLYGTIKLREGQARLEL